MAQLLPSTNLILQQLYFFVEFYDELTDLVVFLLLEFQLATHKLVGYFGHVG